MEIRRWELKPGQVVSLHSQLHLVLEVSGLGYGSVLLESVSGHRYETSCPTSSRWYTGENYDQLFVLQEGVR